MKRVLGILSMAITITLFVFTSCNKDNDKNVTDEKSTYIYFKSLEPEVLVKGSGDKDDYTMRIIEDLVKEKSCKYEVVSGLVEFYYQQEMVFSVNFGNGNCDGLAVVTWVKEDGSTKSIRVDVWRLFKKDDDLDKCFELVLPIHYLMPDDSDFIIETKDDWAALRAWYENHPNYNAKPIMQYPVDIEFKGDKIITVTNERELMRYKEGCDSSDDKIIEVISEELIRSESCNGEVVSGLIEYYDQKRNWLFSINFGDGECDGIATKCWIDKETEERDCTDFDVNDWKPRG
ncbi:MAG: hypothetical protein GQ527_11555 [Bacteroidales bacterium]|nr:hypothetical protein [Bacteroidales bacterium]